MKQMERIMEQFC